MGEHSGNLANSSPRLRHYNPQVHESFRSENILFFAPRTSDTNEDTSMDPSEKSDLTQPWIFGFEFSRPDNYFSAGFIDTCPDRDVYRHPERQGQPLTTFKKEHDIYALGIVLLEIGNSPSSSSSMLRRSCIRRYLATCCYPGKEPICARPRLAGASLRDNAASNKARPKASGESNGVKISRHCPEMHQWRLWDH